MASSENDPHWDPRYSTGPQNAVITLTPEALKNINNMLNHIWRTEIEYGNMHKKTIEMKDSFIRSIIQVFNFPGRVMAEDDLSLIIDSYITLGLIYHRSSDTWSTHS